MKTVLLIILVALSTETFCQQTDTTKFHSPRKASILSAIVPGAGQVYNKKYWKVPIIYASFATGIYFINDNQQKYNTYKNAFLSRSNGEIDDYYDVYNESQLITIMDYYERNRDVSYIITAAIYVLNIVDASVDAHLFHYDINEDLSFEWQPTIYVDTYGNKTLFSLKMNF